MKRLLVVLACLTSTVSMARAASLATVRVPIVDVRQQPSLPAAGLSDPLEETQVLFGESVEIVGSSGSWKQIAVVDQPEFTHHERWEGYPGWVPAASLVEQVIEPTAIVTVRWANVSAAPKGPPLFRLPLGSRVRVVRNTNDASEIDLLDGKSGWISLSDIGPLLARHQDTARRDAILATARKLLGDPYVWGGRSPHDPEGRSPLSGVDCSGLVHLSYSVNGLKCPRDAHEQWMVAKPLKRAELKPGDLIFSAPLKSPKKVSHVALYVGNRRILEAPQTGLAVREISFRKKYGRDLSKVNSGDTVGERVIYFGRLIP